MRDQEDCDTRNDTTLTGRIARIEKTLIDHGLGNDLRDEGDMLRGAGQRHINDVLSRGADFDAVERNIERAGISKREQTAFEEIINRIQTGTDRICMIAAKLEEIGTRVMGPLPENGEGAAALGKSPDGMLDHTFIALNWLDQALCRLHTAAARIERV